MWRSINEWQPRAFFDQLLPSFCFCLTGHLMSQLNPKQQEAMLYVSGPLLVLAGAGSGKTSVITRKIAYLIEECNMPAERITAVTFTNKAAREMKARVSKLLPSEKTRGLTVSTFHQFGLQFLRYELIHTPLKGNFSIMDSDDSKRLLMELMMRDNLSGAESRELVGKAIKMISDWKNDLIEPDKAMETLDDPEDMIFATLYALYERNLRAYNAVDFDDLIVLPTKILRENRELRDKWQNRIRYLLVDEYQDTNPIQSYILDQIRKKETIVGVIGDKAQSIYAFQGANPHLFESFNTRDSCHYTINNNFRFFNSLFVFKVYSCININWFIFF